MNYETGNSEAIRVTKKFTFDMAHALHGHDGLCKNIHGHTYHLSVTIIGKPLMEKGHPKDGMIIDFGDFKKIIQEHVVSVFDHALVLNETAGKKNLQELTDAYQRVIWLPFQPSCENLIIEFKNRLQPLFNHNMMKLVSLRLDETPTSYAEWFLSDNI